MTPREVFARDDIAWLWPWVWVQIGSAWRLGYIPAVEITSQENTTWVTISNKKGLSRSIQVPWTNVRLEHPVTLIPAIRSAFERGQITEDRYKKELQDLSHVGYVFPVLPVTMQDRNGIALRRLDFVLVSSGDNALLYGIVMAVRPNEVYVWCVATNNTYGEMLEGITHPARILRIQLSTVPSPVKEMLLQVQETSK